MLERYHKLQPKTKTIAELKAALQLIWDDMPQEPIIKAIKDFTKRLKACVQVKDAYVIPRLKKPTLPCEGLSSYRPISNLPFLSKLLERVVSVQLTDYLSSAGLLLVHQSAYRKFHSTETALLKVVTDLIDAGDHALLGLLDLSAAFDTVDHEVLVERLARTYGLRSTAL